MGRIQAVLFDLDGTLVDSLRDIHAALTAALADLGLPPPAEPDVRAWIGDGARMLVTRAVRGDADVDRAYERFGVHYRARPLVYTKLYDGVAAALDAAAAPGRTFAVLSNKPHDLTRVIAEHLLAPWPFATVLGAKAGIPLKPDPTAALIAADELGVPPERCAMVGDSAVDVATGRSAGMRAIAVTWGFRPRAELVAAGADAIVDDPRDLAAAIG